MDFRKRNLNDAKKSFQVLALLVALLLILTLTFAISHHWQIIDSPKKTFLTLDKSSNDLQSEYSLLEEQRLEHSEKWLALFFILIIFFSVIFYLVWGLLFKPLYKRLNYQNSKLLTAVLESKSANRSKADFLANISHEIRTPMTAIMGYAELLKEDDHSEVKKNEAVDIVNRNAKHLLNLVDEILDISKIEAGKLKCEKDVINLSVFFNEVLNLVKVRASEKNIEIQILNSSQIPEFIDSDPRRLKQILVNLIGNAIKFTDKGSVTVLVSFSKSENKLNVEVKDTGVGIDIESLKNLFKPFSQGDSSVSRKYGGAGLGLVLSRGLAQALGGNIEVLNSELGVGTTFKLSIDVGNSVRDKLVSSFRAEQSRVEIDEPTSAFNLREKSILVVDDAKENARLFSIYLTKAGATVSVANGGQEAINLFKESKFDIVLLDLQMPGMDGFQTIRELRSLGFNKPILALTAHAMKEEKERTQIAGFDDHITKPVTSDFLISSVCTNLNL